MIAVVICAVKMSTARVASYVVLMDANWTVLTLVSNEISLLLNAILVSANRHNIRELKNHDEVHDDDVC